jgi:hypothetical protein
MMTLTCQLKRTLIGTLQMFNSEEEMDLIIEILARVCGTTCAHPDTTSPRHRRRDQFTDLQLIVVPGGFGRSTAKKPEQCRRDGFSRTLGISPSPVNTPTDVNIAVAMDDVNGRVQQKMISVAPASAGVHGPLP